MLLHPPPPHAQNFAVLLKFVSDKPRTFESGTLYAAKLSGQRNDTDGKPTWDVRWIELGRGEGTRLPC